MPDTPSESAESPNSDNSSDNNTPEYYQFERAKMEHERHQQAGMLGWVGKFLGGRDEKAGNIAGLMVLLCILVISILTAVGAYTGKWENFDTTIGVLGATLTACLGYLFGRK